MRSSTELKKQQQKLRNENFRNRTEVKFKYLCSCVLVTCADAVAFASRGLAPFSEWAVRNNSKKGIITWKTLAASKWSVLSHRYSIYLSSSSGSSRGDETQLNTAFATRLSALFRASSPHTYLMKSRLWALADKSQNKRDTVALRLLLMDIASHNKILPADRPLTQTIAMPCESNDMTWHETIRIDWLCVCSRNATPRLSICYCYSTRAAAHTIQSRTAQHRLLYFNICGFCAWIWSRADGISIYCTVQYGISAKTPIIQYEYELLKRIWLFNRTLEPNRSGPAGILSCGPRDARSSLRPSVYFVKYCTRM